MIIARSRSSMSMSGSISDWPLMQIVELLQAVLGRLAGEIDRDQVDAALLQRRAAIRLGVQIVVDQREAHLGMVEDVVHVGRAEHGVDRHPDQAGAMNAEQRFDELDRVVADRRNLLAGLQPARDEVIREAVGVALELGKRHAPRAVGQRNPIRKPRRRAASGDRRSRPGRCGRGPARRRWLRDWSCGSSPSWPVHLRGALATKRSVLVFVVRTPTRIASRSLANDDCALMPDPENLSRFRGARDRAAGVARAGRQCLRSTDRSTSPWCRRPR